MAAWGTPSSWQPWRGKAWHVLRVFAVCFHDVTCMRFEGLAGMCCASAFAWHAQSVGAHGAEALARCLAANSTLHTLTLNCNEGFGDAGRCCRHVPHACPASHHRTSRTPPSLPILLAHHVTVALCFQPPPPMHRSWLAALLLSSVRGWP